jgi:ABC-type proline/glycine betaine transport system ATPase subunit
MLDPQTRQKLQTKFQEVKPQLKTKFSGVTDQDLDTGLRLSRLLADRLDQRVRITATCIEILVGDATEALLQLRLDLLELGLELLPGLRIEHGNLLML